MKINSKKMGMILLLILVSTTLIYAGGQREDATESVRMRVGTIESTNNLGAITVNKFGEIVEQKSNGEIKVEPFHDSQLGSANRQLELVKSGTLEAFRGSLVWLSAFEPGLSLIVFPYISSTVEEAKLVAQSDAMQRLNDNMAKEHGIRFISSGWVRLPRHVITTSPVSKVEDLTGMKIRVPELYPQIQTFRALGAAPTPVAFSEAYMALRQGIVDGAENHAESLYNMKWHEVGKYIALTHHSYDVTGFIVNDKWWNSLTDAQRQIILDTDNELDSWFNVEVAKLQDHYFDLMQQEGVTITEVDIESFRSKVFPDVMIKAEQDGQWDKGLFEEVMAALK